MTSDSHVSSRAKSTHWTLKPRFRKRRCAFHPGILACLLSDPKSLAKEGFSWTPYQATLKTRSLALKLPRNPSPARNLSPARNPHLVQSHRHPAAAFLSLVRCLSLLQVLWREEALPHPRGACRTVEGAAHVLVTLCGPAGNGIAAAPPEACSGRRLAVVRSALPPFWHCCHH